MMNATDGSGQGGMGISHSLRGGETCMGFFLDGDEAQQPVVMGLINRHLEIKDSAEMKNAFATFSGYKPTGKNPTKFASESGVVSSKDKNANAKVGVTTETNVGVTTTTESTVGVTTTTTKTTIDPTK